MEKAAKRAVSEARDLAYEDLYQRLDTKGAEGTSIRWPRSEEEDKGCQPSQCIKDGADQGGFKKDGRSKVMCPCIPIEVWRGLRDIAIVG